MMRTSRIRRDSIGRWLALTIACGAVGCASSPSGAPPGNATDGALPGFGSTDPQRSDAGVFVSAVSGRFIDGDGNPPPAGSEASVCGPICYLSATEADGTFSVPIKAPLELSEFSALPHGRPLIAGFYFALPADAAGPNIDLGDLRLVRMPDDGPAIDLNGSAAQTLTSGPATLELAAGTQTKLEFDDVAAMVEGSKFRAVAVDPAVMGRFVPSDASLVVALGPFESYGVDDAGAVIPARIAFQNTPKLPAGTPLEFLALGTYLHPDWIAPAEFARVATGAVSSDGATLELDAGAGFRYLTWVAIRPSQSS